MDEKLEQEANKRYPPSNCRGWIQDVDLQNEAFIAGAEWQKQKAIEAYCNSNHSFLCVLQGRNDFSCRESCKHIKEFINTL